jgi:hypothetical protein
VLRPERPRTATAAAGAQQSSRCAEHVARRDVGDGGGRALWAQADAQVEVLDVKGMKKLVLAFEKVRASTKP